MAMGANSLAGDEPNPSSWSSGSQIVLAQTIVLIAFQLGPPFIPQLLGIPLQQMVAIPFLLATAFPRTLSLLEVTAFEHVIHAVDEGDFFPILACFQGGGVVDVGIGEVICW